MFLKSIYYSINTLHDITHVTYINSYMFRQRVAILWEWNERRWTNQPVNICIVYCITKCIFSILLRFRPDPARKLSANLYDISLLCVQWKTPIDGQRNCPKHVEFYSKNKFEKLVHLVGFNIRIYHDARSPEGHCTESKHWFTSSINIYSLWTSGNCSPNSRDKASLFITSAKDLLNIG